MAQVSTREAWRGGACSHRACAERGGGVDVLQHALPTSEERHHVRSLHVREEGEFSSLGCKRYVLPQPMLIPHGLGDGGELETFFVLC